MDLTYHGAKRLQQRRISDDIVDLVVRYGMKIEQNGSTVHFLGKRHVPDGLAVPERAIGTAVVIDRNGRLITGYRCQRLARRFRRRGRR